MKRFILRMGCVLLVFLSALPAASANSRGLTGDLLEAVSADSIWDDYTMLCKQAGDIAVLHSRHQVVLMTVNDGVFSVYPRAVYQPNNLPDAAVTLTQTANGFTLAYGDAEQYTFALQGGAYRLQTAVVGDFRLDAVMSGSTIEHYTATEGTESALLRRSFDLNDFNISLFPRSVEEVRSFNYMRAALYSGYDCLGWLTYMDMPDLNYYSGVGTGTEPVYAAPSGPSAWRAANGKAAVGLKGELWAMGTFRNTDGTLYTCIRYNINTYTQRIGYIRSAALGITGNGSQSVIDAFLYVNVQATRDTYVTDDPDVSQTERFTVPQGTQFTCLGLYNNSYAYVAAEVRDGKFVDGGAILWGFVPLNALTLDENFQGAVQTDVMAALTGTWAFTAGGSMADDQLILNADGTFLAGYAGDVPDAANPDEHGTWTVTKYNPSWNLYWADTKYELTLLRDNGTAIVKGLLLNDDGFSLIDSEGSGGYERVDPDENPDITTPAQHGQVQIDDSSGSIMG